MTFRPALFALGLFLAACDVPLPPTTNAPADAGQPRVTAQAFLGVVEQMEPVAEAVCRDNTIGANCDFQIAVDTRRNQPPNAFQTLDENGRPLIVFTVSLIARAENNDELAFVLGHEAAHHISGHLDRTQSTAMAGAVLGGLLATIAGGNAAAIDQAQNVGATIGARTYSKEFELEADRLGTIITHRAGFNARRGSQFFTKIPDPGDRFLGTHPPNAARIQAVEATLATLG